MVSRERVLDIINGFDRGLDSIVDDFWFGNGVGPRTRKIEKDGKIFLKMELPGYEKEDVKVSVKNGLLTISAEDKKEENKDWFRKSSITSFMKSWGLPVDAKVEEISAELKSGILVVTIPLGKEKAKDEFSIPVK